MHMVLATRHPWRSAFLYGPVIRSLAASGVEITLLGAEVGGQNDAILREFPLSRVESVGIRPLGERPAPLEWLVLSGRLIAVAEEQGPIDVLLSFEEDLAPALTLAGRVAGVRLVVAASDRVRAPAPEQVAHAAESLFAALRAQAKDVSLHEALEGLLHQVERFVPPQEFEEKLHQVFGEGSSLRSALRGIQRRVVPVQMVLHYGFLAAKSVVDRRVEPLKQRLLKGAPIHWLLASPPDDTPPAGYTDFEYSTGLDVEAWITSGEGRSFGEEDGAPLRVGVWRDPWLRAVSDEHLEHTLRSACARGELKGALRYVPVGEAPAGAVEEIEAWAASVLKELDVAVVPGGDLHASMQAQAAGVAVITRQGSPAARAIRSGETGLALASLDLLQLASAFASLAGSGRVASLQREAQRRALRHFDYEAWLRRLTRELDARLTNEATQEPEDDEDDGDLLGPLQRERRRHI